MLADALDDSLDSLVDTTLHLHRVSTRGDVFQTYIDDALSEYRSGSRTITSILIGLRCHLTYELGTHILKLVLQLDLLSDRHTILGNVRSAIATREDHVATLRAKCHLYSV